MRGHIAKKSDRYYPVISMKDPGTGKWKRKWLSGYRTKREAEKARAEAVTQANNGWLLIPSRETIAQLFDNYLNTTGALRVRPITLQSYKSMVQNHLIPKLGAKLVSALTPDDLNFIMAGMKENGISVTTTRYLLRIIHRVLNDAVRKGKLIRNVAALADPPPAKKAEFSIWNEQELDVFLTAAAQYGKLYELFAILALIGLRVSEGIGLQWHDMDLNSDQPACHIRRTAYKIKGGQWRYEEPKTPRSRRKVELPRALALLLRRWLEQQEAKADWSGRELQETDFIFAREDGTLPDRHYASKVFQRIIKQAELPRIRLQDLRHTAATLLRKNGRSIEEISKMLGHANEAITVTIYSHWKGESRAVADTMDLILEKAEKNRSTGAFIRNSLEEGEGVESRPYRSRTCDTLIKSQVDNFPIFRVFSKLKSAQNLFSF